MDCTLIEEYCLHYNCPTDSHWLPLTSRLFAVLYSSKFIESLVQGNTVKETLKYTIHEPIPNAWTAAGVSFAESTTYCLEEELRGTKCMLLEVQREVSIVGDDLRSHVGSGPLCFIKFSVGAAVYHKTQEEFQVFLLKSFYGDSDTLPHCQTCECLR